MPTLYLVRHASPDWTRTDIPYHIPPGPPLSAQGLIEARTAAQFLRKAGVRRVYSSPLERCLHTARLTAEAAAAPLEVLDGLREWQPQESLAVVLARALPVVQEVWQGLLDGAEGPVALFTHGGPIMALLGALGIDDATMETLRVYDHRNPVPPAGIWQISPAEAGDENELDLRLVFVPPTAPTIY